MYLMIVPSFWEKGWENVCDMIQTLRSEDSGETRDANASKAQLLFGLDHYACALVLWWSCSLRITLGRMLYHPLLAIKNFVADFDQCVGAVGLYAPLTV
jgi:hypothetical protein